MTPYTLIALPEHEQPSVRVSGARKQSAAWAVFQGSRLVAVFRNENEARAYMARRNQLARQTA